MEWKSIGSRCDWRDGIAVNLPKQLTGCLGAVKLVIPSSGTTKFRDTDKIGGVFDGNDRAAEHLTTSNGRGCELQQRFVGGLKRFLD
jgi:hypothetical protein